MHKIHLLTLLTGCLLLTACERPQPQAEYQLFLLAGQSNMAGRGVVAEEDRVAYPNILALNREGEWAPAIDPIHFDKPIAGVGPGRSFAIALVEKQPEVTIGLIPAAVGGSPISSWEPGALDQATNTHPYDDAMERARIAMQSGELKAILWHQGESDSNEERAPQYKEKLITLIARLRTDLGNEDLPVLLGQLGQFSEKPWDEWRRMVNDTHIEVAQEVDDVYFVSSEGLSHKGDTLHFSASAEREFGRRYARTYLDDVMQSDQ